MGNQPEIEQLTSLARRLEGDGGFMAYVLATYRRQEGISDEELAMRFGIPPALLVRLALCRRPLRDVPDYVQSIKRLADATLIDEGILANVLHQVEALDRLTNASGLKQASPLQGLLTAARDRTPEKHDEAGPPGEKDAESNACERDAEE